MMDDSRQPADGTVLHTMEDEGRPPIIIRYATPADSQAISDMMGKVLKLSEHHGEDRSILAEFEPRGWVQARLGLPDYFFLVAELEHRLVGYIECRRRISLPREPTGWRRWTPRRLWRRWRERGTGAAGLRVGHRSGVIHSVYVVRAQRPRNVGGVLGEVLEREVGRQGIDRLEASILWENRISQAFSRRQGYRPYRVHVVKKMGD